jgi:uncharacterized membrane-anchored protein YjiN (DUF445 family)
LADWFAVVALFRHPLGIPIPHTAIIPSSKARIADSLAQFVRDHFLNPKSLYDLLKQFDLAAHLADWLRDAAGVKRVVDQARSAALGALHTLDDLPIRKALLEILSTEARRWNAATTAGEVLELITRDGRHQALLDSGLEKIGKLLSRESVKAEVSKRMQAYAREEWPKVVSVVDSVSSVSRLANSFAEKLGTKVLGELQDVLRDPNHHTRQQYDVWFKQYIHQLQTDLELQKSFNDIKERLISDPTAIAFVGSLWTEIKRRLETDLADPESVVGKYAERLTNTVGNKLASDPALRESVNTHLLQAVESASIHLQDGVAAHISKTIKDWDDEQLVRELELSVGPDLQFIRMSGTLVGGVVGLALHGVGVLLVA